MQGNDCEGLECSGCCVLADFAPNNGRAVPAYMKTMMGSGIDRIRNTDLSLFTTDLTHGTPQKLKFRSWRVNNE